MEGEYFVSPTGKSFRFVGVCERAGGAREINAVYMGESAGRCSSSFFAVAIRWQDFGFNAVYIGDFAG